ncbi:transposase, partial [Candidatus Bathyarchaeota archaeon]|nr:IS110 family transposase [Candidatus Bathyarchaeota archaeon]NIR17782.1 IS110 family transposase [Desulfobacterales bacterium]NIU81497.1 transposase [Candidatus Bathyarchaeota archaeon]NIV68138.1 transposase [Candidatus Bathyarchaeota archaeon]NIW34651.1 transposase [Candidatus Bathyarchaeota archaeon]
IGDINDFEDEKKLAAYFGIVPRVSNSNETRRQGRITKQGSKLGRTTLVQCTLIAIRYSDYLRS